MSLSLEPSPSSEELERCEFGSPVADGYETNLEGAFEKRDYLDSISANSGSWALNASSQVTLMMWVPGLP
jgi:hypothetical protein